MKNLHQIGMAVVLTLALATGAFAGIIETPAAPPPPSSITVLDPASAVATGASDQQTSENSFGMVALNLLQTMLTVF
jgi:hypothetical protein